MGETFLGFLAALAVLMLGVLLYAEVVARQHGQGILRAVRAAMKPKVTMQYQVIRANGTREEIRDARTAKASLRSRLKIAHITILLHLKKMLDDFSNYLKRLGG